VRSVTDRFLKALRGSHLIATECVLHFPGEAEPVTVPIEGGAVTIDRTAQVRRTANVVIPWSLRIGLDLGLDLRTLPLGGYCHLARGLRFPGGVVELVALGYFRVESVTWRTSDESASLELADRMAQVRDEPFLAPYTPTVLPEITRPGTLTDNSPVVTGLATTADLIVGMTITAAGVPPGTKILSIDSGSQITMTQPGQIHAYKSVRGFGDSNRIGVETTTDLVVGMAMSLPGLYPPGTTLDAIESPTVAVTSFYWAHSGEYGGNVTFTLPATPSIKFSGSVLIADVAVEIAQAVFGTTIAYQKLWAPIVVLGDVFYTGGRAEALHALALAAGGETYFDANGDYVFDRQAGGTEPVWTLDAGEAGVLVGADESLNRTGVYNGVLFQGQSTADAAPIVALATDDDPTSPTRWGGPFGKVARIEQSSAVTTLEQAEEAAAILLDRRLTLTRALTVTTAPNPAIEAGDVVTVLFPDGREERHIVDAVRIGLGPLDPQVFTLHAVAALEAGALNPRRPYGIYAGAAAWRELRGARRRPQVPA